MQRSGSTLQYQIVCAIAEEMNLNCKFRGWTKPSDFDTSVAQLVSDSEFAIYKNHNYTNAIDKFINSNDYFVFYIYRDVRDACVSLMEKENITFDVVFNSGFFDNCIDNYRKWTRLEKVYIAKYEDVTLDLSKEVVAISNVMKANINDNTVNKIVDSLSLGSQRKKIEGFDQANLMSSGTQKFHPESLLHHNHINDGRIGKYYEVLTSSQIELVNNKYSTWLVERGYSLN